MDLDLKQIGLFLAQLEEEKGISKEEVMGALEDSFASAYKRQYGERGQIIRSNFDINTGAIEYFQVKEVISPEQIITEEEYEKMNKEAYLFEKEEKGRVRFNEERYILLEHAKLIKNGVEVGEEISFSLEAKSDFGRVAAQSAKQTIVQKIREAENRFITNQFGDKIGTIVSGNVVRVEGGNIYVDLGKVEGIISYNEQIKKESYKTGDRIRAYLTKANTDTRNQSLLELSRSHPNFLQKLFEEEVPEISSGDVIIKAITREPGFRSKVAVYTENEEIDPVGSLVGGSGSRVNAVSSELSGERIDIIEWSENPEEFIEEAISPAEIISVEINEKERIAKILVSEDQFSLAIGRSGQNVRLAARLTGYKIDIAQPENFSEIEKTQDGENFSEEKESVEEMAEEEKAQSENSEEEKNNEVENTEILENEKKAEPETEETKEDEEEKNEEVENSEPEKEEEIKK